MNYSLYTVLFSFIAVVDIVIAEFSADDCKVLGFNKANLLCSTCEHFTEPSLAKILSSCKECCLKDDYDLSGSRRYPKAVLEVCTCKFGQYPQIQAFIKSDRPKKYKNLSIKYVRGLDPIIKLYDAENRVEDVLDIHKWDTDSVDEFLSTHLSKD
ncbi:selenoprotein F [Linepithema humile]|uniref:selenoprotein F n=1 Tax=Linepithema humile TaxID=83485 RepID=UPI0006233D7E|nr:PREDICTED: 15 kDa selenoprotein [Linepithema humile]